MTETTESIPRIQRIIAVLWPSFLTAGVATVMLFILFSPDEMFPEQRAAGTSSLAIYSLSFLFLWATTLLACVMSCYFLRPCKRCS